MKKRKGIAILWTLITGGVMLFLATIMVKATIKESQMVINFSASTKASSAARSGITWATWCVDHQDDCGYLSPEKVWTYTINGADVTVKITDQEIDGKTVYDVESIGSITSGSTVTRKLLFRYQPKSSTYINARSITNTASSTSYYVLSPSHPNSFTYAYSMWVDKNTSGYITYLHHYDKDNPNDYQNPSPGSIRIEYDNNSSKPRLILGSPNPNIPTKTINLFDPNDPTKYVVLLNNPFAIRVEIKYIKNVNISMSVRVKSADGTLPELTYRTTTSALGVNLGSIDRVTMTRPGVPGSTRLYNDGDYVEIRLPMTTNAFLANLEHWGNP